MQSFPSSSSIRWHVICFSTSPWNIHIFSCFYIFATFFPVLYFRQTNSAQKNISLSAQHVSTHCGPGQWPRICTLFGIREPEPKIDRREDHSIQNDSSSHGRMSQLDNKTTGYWPANRKNYYTPSSRLALRNEDGFSEILIKQLPLFRNLPT